MYDFTIFELCSPLELYVVVLTYLSMLACISMVEDGELTAVTLKFVDDQRTGYRPATSTMCKSLIAQGCLGIHQSLRCC